VLPEQRSYAADHNGVENVSHIKDKLVEMTHLNETIYNTGIASSYQASEMKSGVFLNDDMIAGRLMVTAPSQQDFAHPEIGELIKKYLKGRKDIDVEDQMRILRLIENMTLGRNAVGYLTESMHGAGSPQAQRIQIGRQMQKEFKKQLARTFAGVEPDVAADVEEDLPGYMARVFAPTEDK